MAHSTPFVHTRSQTPPSESGVQAIGLDHAFNFLSTASPTYSPTRLPTIHPSATDSLQTPPHSSPLADAAERREQEHNNRKRKRVVWGETSFENEPTVGDSLSSMNGNGCRAQQPKSILKASAMSSQESDNELASSQVDGAMSSSGEDSASSLDQMLSSMILQLRSPQLQSHHDAYKILNQMLQAQDIHGRIDEFKEQLPFLEEYIRADVSRQDNASPEPLVAATVCEALKAACALVHESNNNPKISLSVDFQRFMILNSIGDLQTGKTSKQITRMHTVLLKEVKITEHMLSAEHAVKLVTVLCDSNDRESSTNFLLQRLHIFDSLLKHHAPSMVKNCHIWIDCVVSAMLAKLAHLRQIAITFGMRVGTQLNPHADLADCLLSLLQRQNEKGRTFVEDLVDKLDQMMEDPETIYDVPTIWSVFIMMLRARRSEFLQSHCHTKLLVLFQKCFNTHDEKLKTASFLAWDKFVYFTKISPGMSRRTISNLVAVFKASQMRSNSICKTVQESSHLLHLYYAFRPRQPEEKTTSEYHARLTLFWNDLIDDVLHKKNSCKAGMFQKILASLFTTKTGVSWDLQRALRTEKEPLRVEQLPALDPAWVRQNVGLMLNIVMPLFSRLDSRAGWPPPVWKALLQCIATASSREIIFSGALRSAATLLVDSLCGFWIKGSAAMRSGVGGLDWIIGYCGLVEEMFKSIHATHLRDLLLTAEDLRHVPQVKGKSLMSVGEHLSPVALFLRLLQYSPLRTTHLDAIHNLIKSMFAGFEGTSAAQAELVVSLLQDNTCSGEQTTGSLGKEYIWTAAVCYCSTLVEHVQPDRSELLRVMARCQEGGSPYIASEQSMDAASYLTRRLLDSCDSMADGMLFLDHYAQPLCSAVLEARTASVEASNLHASDLLRSLRRGFGNYLASPCQVKGSTVARFAQTDEDAKHRVSMCKARVRAYVSGAVFAMYDAIRANGPQLSQVRLLNAVAEDLKDPTDVDDGLFKSLLKGICLLARDEKRFWSTSSSTDADHCKDYQSAFKDGVWPAYLERTVQFLQHYSDPPTDAELHIVCKIVMSGLRSSEPHIARTTLDTWNRSIAPLFPRSMSARPCRQLAGLLETASSSGIGVDVQPLHLAHETQILILNLGVAELFPGLTCDAATKASVEDQSSLHNAQHVHDQQQEQVHVADRTCDETAELVGHGEEMDRDQPSIPPTAEQASLDRVSPIAAPADEAMDVDHEDGHAPITDQSSLEDPEAAKTDMEREKDGERCAPSAPMEGQQVVVASPRATRSSVSKIDSSVEILEDDSFAEALRQLPSVTRDGNRTLTSAIQHGLIETTNDDNDLLRSAQQDDLSSSDDEVFVDAESSPLRPRSANKPPTPSSRLLSLFRQKSLPRSKSSSTQAVAIKKDSKSNAAVHLQSPTVPFNSATAADHGASNAPEVTSTGNDQAVAQSHQEKQQSPAASKTDSPGSKDSNGRRKGGVWRTGKWTYAPVNTASENVQESVAQSEDHGVVTRTRRRRQAALQDSASPADRTISAQSPGSKKRRRAREGDADEVHSQSKKSKSTDVGESVEAKIEQDSALGADPLPATESEQADTNMEGPETTNVEVGVETSAAPVDDGEAQQVGEGLDLSFAVVEEDNAEPQVVDAQNSALPDSNDTPFDQQIATEIRSSILPFLQQALPKLGALQIKIGQHENSTDDKMLDTAYSLGQIQSMILNLQQDTLRTIRGANSQRRPLQNK